MKRALNSRMYIDNIKTFQEHPRRRPTFIDFSFHRINYILPLIVFVPETSHNTEGKHVKRIYSVEILH